MSQSPKARLETFNFHNLHPQVLIGTASDRYAGWIGQIYSHDRYQGKIAKRTNIIGGKSFIEEVLPVDSVEEYFEHFPVLEIDFIFYRPLLDPNGQPNQNYEVLKNYAKHSNEGDRIILKVPQMVMAQKIRKGDYHVANPAYLNPKIFTEQFYEPAVNLLGANLTGFIFEQEYQRKEDRLPVVKMAYGLNIFFSQIPKDSRYHLELRTDEDSYVRAYPFDKLVDGMMQPEMILEAVEILRTAVEKGVLANVFINNRAGGNAPMIAQEIAKKFLGKPKSKTPHQMNLWDS